MIDWTILEQTCLYCQRCALADRRTQVLFGTGNPKATVLVVGHVPSQEEDRVGEPFLGEEGKLLDDLLSIIRLNRSHNTYMTTAVKCCPPNNRPPLSTERRSCLPYLRQQIALIKPKIILCLGQEVASGLLQPDFDLEEEHGIFYEQDGADVMAIYPPATLLQEPHTKAPTFDDIKKLEQRILEIAPETYGQTSSLPCSNDDTLF